MNTPTVCLNLARTSTALAAYDAAVAAMDTANSIRRATNAELLRTEKCAAREVGRAYAFDTCDRNDPADVARWAAGDPDRIHAIVEEYRADVAAGRRIAPACEVSYTVALAVAGVFRDG